MWFFNITLFLLEKPIPQLTEESFIEKYGTLIEGLNLTTKKRSYWIKAYYPLFLIRRLMYSACLVSFMSYPKVQLFLCFLLLVVPVI